MIQNWLLSLVLLSASVLGLCICVRTSRLKQRGEGKVVYSQGCNGKWLWGACPHR